MRGHRTITTKRRLATITPTVIGAVLALMAGSATAALPSGVTAVAVTAGNTTSGIDAHLHRAASIAGRITALSGGGALSGSVEIFHSGKPVAFGFADSSGNYVAGGLAAGSYAVCIGGFSVSSGGSSTTGYLGRCYQTATWNGSTVPATAKLITVTPGQQKTGVNIALPSGAAVAGKATNASGTGVSNVNVLAHNRSNGASYFGYTTSKGTYRINGLSPSAKGYSVCFDPRGNQTGTGFRSGCYKHAAWGGFGTAFPSTANSVAVSTGHVHTGINITLARAGAVAGAVTDAANGHAVPNAGVLVYSSGGKILQSAVSNANGRYVVRGLAAASGDRVCVSPVFGSASTTFKGKCWKNVAYNGRKLPTGTTGVSIHTARTHSGISFKLAKTVLRLGSIAGTITELTGGSTIQGATVLAYSGGNSFAGSATSDAAGHYTIPNLRASSTGYLVCAAANTGAFSSTPTPPSGWAPRCHPDSAWNGLLPPKNGTKLPLSAGQHRSGVNIALHTGGAIAGTARDSATNDPAAFVTVKVFTTAGVLVNYTSTQFDGTYSMGALSPGSYVVCFDGQRAQFNGPGWRPACYNDVAWGG